jgi:hypothetical protein
LKWSEGSLQVGSVGLEVVESAGNAGLKLRWVLARWARGRDLVEGAHGCGVVVREFLDILRCVIEKRNCVGVKFDLELKLPSPLRLKRYC